MAIGYDFLVRHYRATCFAQTALACNEDKMHKAMALLLRLLLCETKSIREISCLHRPGG